MVDIEQLSRSVHLTDVEQVAASLPDDMRRAARRLRRTRAVVALSGGVRALIFCPAVKAGGEHVGANVDQPTTAGTQHVATSAAAEYGSNGLTASVVIPTYNRPEQVRTCLQHLVRQTVRPVEVVVVDGSSDNRTRDVVADFSDVIYERNPMGRGATPESRAIGVSRVSGDIVGFLDDDANARPDWLAQLLQRYEDPQVAGVGGAAVNLIPGERQLGLGSVGLLLPDGRLTGFFAADTGHDIEVDHLLGANMSFRRSAIEEIGGIHGGYPGTCLREESDLALRVRNRGHRLIFAPDAIVEHLPGPYAKGKRFDRRYSFYGNRNHIVLLARTFGLTSSILRTYVVTALREIVIELLKVSEVPDRLKSSGTHAAFRYGVGGLLRAAALLGGMLSGFPAAVGQVRADRARGGIVSNVRGV